MVARIPGALIALAMAACSPYVERGEALYAEGRFVEAAEVFERTEARLAESSERTRAEYGLYRGLTFLQLDDLRGARQWLAYAHRLGETRPGLIEDGERRLLDRAWSELERRTHEPTAEPTTVAATDVRAAGPASNGRRTITE